MAANDYFGISAAISGNTVLVGAYGDDYGAGSAYVFCYQPCEATPLFIRGDADGDGRVQGLFDGIFLLKYGFLEGPAPGCFDAADVDGNNALHSLIDPLYLLKWAFTNGPAPPDPGPTDCGPDPEGSADGIDCENPAESCL